ncbi:MAG TPA: hypothetical protein G4O00_11980 [Thermoflexia bacterium]|nr:hypothetical protein [Thermoflexia bacterium]
MRKHVFVSLATLLGLLALTGIASAQEPPPQGDGIVRILYFYSVDCPHCQVVEQEVLAPLQAEYGDRLDLRKLEIGDPINYELLVRTEEYFDVAPERRGLPTVVVDGQVLIGEDEVRRRLCCLIETCLAEGGTAWPDIPGLAEALQHEHGVEDLPFGPTGEDGICEMEEATACETEAPIWAAYFYQVGCQECSRAEIDIRYLRSRYPQLIVEEFNIYDDLPLAQWLAQRVGREGDLHAPAFFVGDDALIGEGEITPQNLEALMEKYAATGAEKVWADFDAESSTEGLVARFRALGPLTVVVAGLVDGLNPCAFATLVFFIAYLAASQRKGSEILAVGGAFTLGVFLAYLLVGLGLYKVLDWMGNTLTTLGRWVYGLTALFCAVLAVLSFMDYLKARQGRLEEMSLTLPSALKNRARAVVRAGQRARAYVAAAFVTGLLVSLLELACTGQIYLPTLIFVASIPALRTRAYAYLLLYNLFFILPLVVVFGLAYFGTTSMQLGLFLKRHTATVKLGTALVFAALAAWLGSTLL